MTTGLDLCSLPPEIFLNLFVSYLDYKVIFLIRQLSKTHDRYWQRHSMYLMKKLLIDKMGWYIDNVNSKSHLLALCKTMSLSEQNRVAFIGNIISGQTYVVKSTGDVVVYNDEDSKRCKLDINHIIKVYCTQSLILLLNNEGKVYTYNPKTNKICQIEWIHNVVNVFIFENVPTTYSSSQYCEDIVLFLEENNNLHVAAEELLQNVSSVPIDDVIKLPNHLSIKHISFIPYSENQDALVLTHDGKVLPISLKMGQQITSNINIVDIKEISTAQYYSFAITISNDLYLIDNRNYTVCNLSETGHCPKNIIKVTPCNRDHFLALTKDRTLYHFKMDYESINNMTETLTIKGKEWPLENTVKDYSIMRNQDLLILTNDDKLYTSSYSLSFLIVDDCVSSDLIAQGNIKLFGSNIFLLNSIILYVDRPIIRYFEQNVDNVINEIG